MCFILIPSVWNISKVLCIKSFSKSSVFQWKRRYFNEHEKRINCWCRLSVLTWWRKGTISPADTYLMRSEILRSGQVGTFQVSSYWYKNLFCPFFNMPQSKGWSHCCCQGVTWSLVALRLQVTHGCGPLCFTVGTLYGLKWVAHYMGHAHRRTRTHAHTHTHTRTHTYTHTHTNTHTHSHTNKPALTHSGSMCKKKSYC